jgi:hypothetical protein
VPADGEGPITAETPIDESTPEPPSLPPGWRVLFFLGATGERMVLTNSPPSSETVDAWLDGRQVVERGRLVIPYADGLLSIDHSANGDGVGDLVYHPLDGQPPVVLERNVVRYAFVGDQIVAVAHRAVEGPHNRLVAIDLAARRRRLIANGIVDLRNDIRGQATLFSNGLFLVPFRPLAPNIHDVELRYLPNASVPP